MGLFFFFIFLKIDYFKWQICGYRINQDCKKKKMHCFNNCTFLTINASNTPSPSVSFLRLDSVSFFTGNFSCRTPMCKLLNSQIFTTVAVVVVGVFASVHRVNKRTLFFLLVWICLEICLSTIREPPMWVTYTISRLWFVWSEWKVVWVRWTIGTDQKRA